MALIQLKDESMPSSLVIRGITTIGHRQNRGPGVLLHQLYSTIGEQVGKKTDELAQRLGFGPEAVTRRIQEAFGVQEQRLLKLVELHSSSRVARLTLPVTKYCAKLTEYTLRSEAPETRLQAVNCIILLVSLYPGLRQSFIVGKIVQRAGESNEAILKLWEGDEPYSADWEYKRSLAAAFLCEDEIGTLVEATQPEFLGLVDREGSGSVIEKLVSIIDCDGIAKSSGAIAIRYLGGILRLPTFWLKSNYSSHSSVVMKLFRGLEAILKDIGVDTALPDASGTSAPNSISDLQGVDYLAEAILAGITTWLVQIDPEDKPLSWWEGFRVIVKLLRSPKAEGLLPLSWRQASASHVQEWFPVSALDYEEYDILVDNENDPDDTLEIGTPMFSSKPNESSIKPVQEAPTVSQTESEPDESRLFSSADAAIMADAFRKMLQKQDTIESPLEGDIFDATSGIIKDPKGKEKINETTDDASPTGSIPSNEGPFSGADAAIMADAFRKMLRKPDFSERPVEEGDGIDGAEDLERKEEFFSTPLLAGDLQNDEVISSRDAALVADAFRKVRRKPDLPEIPVVERDTSGAVEGPEKGAKRECSIQ